MVKQQLNFLIKGDFSNEQKEEEYRLRKDINRLYEQEEINQSQRARINWLRVGDKNTKFFHSLVIQRRQRNRITKILSSMGKWITDENQIKRAGILHF